MKYSFKQVETKEKKVVKFPALLATTIPPSRSSFCSQEKERKMMVVTFPIPLFLL